MYGQDASPRSKDTIIGEKIMNWIKTEFQAVVMSAQLVAIVGIQPPPHDEILDEHIWAPLRKTRAKLLFVGSEEKCRKWISVNRIDKGDVWVSDTFRAGNDFLCRALVNISPKLLSRSGEHHVLTSCTQVVRPVPHLRSFNLVPWGPKIGSLQKCLVHEIH